MEYAKKVLRFWMDNGVQGFEFDAPAEHVGASRPAVTASARSATASS